MTSVRHWETQILRLTFRPKIRAGGLQEDVITSNASQMEEAESSDGGGNMLKQFGRQWPGLLTMATFPF